MNNLSPRELYSIELFTSSEYFGTLRDNWGDLISHVEQCLENYCINFPANYRNLPLSEQADLVWGERVLPNFRETYQALCDGYICLTHNDVRGLRAASGVRSDFKGQGEFSTDWMSDSDQTLYGRLLGDCVKRAANISTTAGAYRNPCELTANVPNCGTIDFPAQMPQYRLNPNTNVSSGSKIVKTGIYVPDIENSCAQFLSVYLPKAPDAIVHVGVKDLLHPVTQEIYGQSPIFEKRECIWTIVERVRDNSLNLSNPAPTLQPLRIAAGMACPQSGWYFTPADPNSRRQFNKGDIMPALQSDFGATIWQFDSVQE